MIGDPHDHPELVVRDADAPPDGLSTNSAEAIAKGELDLKTLQKNVGKDGVRELLILFLAEIPDEMEKLEISLNDRNATEAMKMLHRAKGAFGSVCADRLRAACCQIEDDVLVANWEQALATFASLRLAVNRLARFIRDRILPCEDN